MYVHQAGFDPSDHDASAAQAVAELTGYTLTKIQDCFAELKGSFLKLSGSKWTFAHPTISNALTDSAPEAPYDGGAHTRCNYRHHSSSFTCEGSPLIRDAVVIQTTLEMLWSHDLAARPTDYTAIGCCSTSFPIVRARPCSSKPSSNFPVYFDGYDGNLISLATIPRSPPMHVLITSASGLTIFALR